MRPAMTETILEQGGVEKGIRGVARRLTRRCWWADERDVAQEGLLAALEARATWDERRGPWPQYAMWMAKQAMRRSLLRDNSPVSAPRSHEDRIKGVRRVGITPPCLGEARLVAADDHAEAERGALIAVAVREALWHHDPSGVAEASLVDGVPWEVICAAQGIGLQEYKGHVMRARRAMGRDGMLEELYEREC